MAPSAGYVKATGLLRDYRWVHENPEAEGGTPFQKSLQQLFKDRPFEFLDRYQRAENAHRSGQGKQSITKADTPSGPVQAEGVDEGVERVEELIERLLGGYEGRS